MPTATLTSKGQITIPLSLRVSLGLHAGAKMDFVLDEHGFKVMPLHKASASLKGRFSGRVAKPASIAAMDEAIAAQVTSRHSALTKSRA